MASSRRTGTCSCDDMGLDFGLELRLLAPPRSRIPNFDMVRGRYQQDVIVKIRQSTQEAWHGNASLGIDAAAHEGALRATRRRLADRVFVNSDRLEDLCGTVHGAFTDDARMSGRLGTELAS